METSHIPNSDSLEKNWDFDEIIERRGTGAEKWESAGLVSAFGEGKEDLLPLWVADMDFNCPIAVKEILEKRIEHQIYGYSLIDPSYFESVISWHKRRHQWSIEKDWILTTPGIVPATNYIIQRFSDPGDKILIQTPVYYPFARSIINNGRTVVENPLRYFSNEYTMNFSDLEEKAKDPRVKLAILCSPHNPAGRVWSQEELETFGNICIENDVLIFSDEIHCDLIMPGFKHISFPTISKRFENNSIVGVAASKTFNLAGLKQSSLIIANPKIRKELWCHLVNQGFPAGVGGNFIGSLATTAAYDSGDTWLDDLLLYLKDNFIYVKETLESQLPGVKVIELQGTYLVWVDFSSLGFDDNKMAKLLEEEARVGLDHGNWFGANGSGFERFNIACPRSILVKAIDSVVSACRKHVE